MDVQLDDVQLAHHMLGMSAQEGVVAVMNNIMYRPYSYVYQNLPLPLNTDVLLNNL